MKGLSSVPLVTAEIFHGRVRNAKPALGDPRPRRSLRSVACEEDGMLSLVTAVAILAFVFFISLIGNAGRSVKDKIEVQNASDAVAHSSALWMARGMNAITATNHLLGELTAIAVLHEAIAGPSDQELDSSSELSLVKTAIRSMQQSARAKWDGPLIKRVVDEMADGDGTPKAGAMLYDARMELRSVCALTFAMKTVAEILVNTGYFTAVGIVMHIAGDAVLVEALIEWQILRFLQEFADGIDSSLETALEEELIPQVAAYPGKMMGESGSGGVLVPLNQAVSQAALQLSKMNRVEAFVFPSPVPLGQAKLELPVRREKAPESGNGLPRVEPYPRMDNELVKEMRKSFKKVSSTIGRLLKLFDWLDNAVSLIPDSLLPDGVQEHLDALSNLNSAFPAANSRVASLSNLDAGYTENPSLAYLNDMKVNWEYEKKSQWVRAAYPYVDQFRLPLAGAMKISLPLSNGTAWYMMWTSRFTLSKAVQYRRGKFSDDDLSMYVMTDTDREKKGKEPWTTNSNTAERLFTLMAASRRDVETIMGQSSFGDPEPKSVVTYSQAIFYNENSQKPDSGTSLRQPTIGWDTLNWDPAHGANEFDKTTPASFGGGALWSGAAFLQNVPSPKVKLNWQAKLVPVTRRRLEQAANSLPQFQKSVQPAVQLTTQLDTH